MPTPIALSKLLHHWRLGSALTLTVLASWACSGAAESSGREGGKTEAGADRGTSPDAVVLTVYSDYV